jgi:hypothetical protein
MLVSGEFSNGRDQRRITLPAFSRRGLAARMAKAPRGCGG